MSSPASSISSSALYEARAEHSVNTRHVVAGGRWSVPDDAGWTETRHWDEEWQRLQDMDDSSETIHTLKRQLMMVLSQEFAEHVVPVVRTLVDERWLPYSAKSIPPLRVNAERPDVDAFHESVLASVSSQPLSEFQLQVHNDATAEGSGDAGHGTPKQSSGTWGERDDSSKRSSGSSLPPVMDLTPEELGHGRRDSTGRGSDTSVPSMRSFRVDGNAGGGNDGVDGGTHSSSGSQQPQLDHMYLMPSVAANVAMNNGTDGDETYFHQGVFFRFATVTRANERVFNNLYVAHKYAAHELRATGSVAALEDHSLHVPLLAVLDYKGERVVASAHMDALGDATVLYGSHDAGELIHNESTALSEVMTKVASKLHLAPHRVPMHVDAGYATSDDSDMESPESELHGGEQEQQDGRRRSFSQRIRRKLKRRKSQEGVDQGDEMVLLGVEEEEERYGTCVTLHGPADMEGYEGQDNRLYAIHLARLLPPHSPSRVVHALYIPAVDDAPVAVVSLGIDEWFGTVSQMLNGEDAPTVRLPLPNGAYMYSSSLSATAQTKSDEWGDGDSGGTPSIVVHSAEGERRQVNTQQGHKKESANKRATALAHQHVYGDAVAVVWPRTQLLTHQFRPEFLRAYEGEAVSSDSYSRFGMVNHRRCNAASGAAYEHLLKTVIPACAHLLDSKSQELGRSKEVCAHMHRMGINLRFLGHVRRHCTKARVRSLILCEMVGRCVKTQLRFVFRQLNRVGETRTEAYSEPVLHAFNQVLGMSTSSAFYWRCVATLQLRLKYGVDALRQEESLPDYDLRQHLLRSQLMESLVHCTGIGIACETQRKLVSDVENWNTPTPISTVDLELGWLSKHVQARGVVFVEEEWREMEEREHAYMLDRIRNYVSPWAKVDDVLAGTKGDGKSARARQRKGGFGRMDSFMSTGSAASSSSGGGGGGGDEDEETAEEAARAALSEDVFYAAARGLLYHRESEQVGASPLHEVLMEHRVAVERERKHKQFDSLVIGEEEAHGLGGAHGSNEDAAASLEVPGRRSSDSHRSDRDWDFVDHMELNEVSDDELKAAQTGESPLGEDNPFMMVSSFFKRTKSKLKSDLFK